MSQFSNEYYKILTAFKKCLKLISKDISVPYKKSKWLTTDYGRLVDDGYTELKDWEGFIQYYVLDWYSGWGNSVNNFVKGVQGFRRDR